MAAETRRTIWRHPRGIYETVEVSGVDFFGEHYCYRETVYTPKQDARGIAREEQKAPPKLRPLATAEEEEQRMVRLYEAEIRSTTSVAWSGSRTLRCRTRCMPSASKCARAETGSKPEKGKIT